MTLKPFATALLQLALLAVGAFVLIPEADYAKATTWLPFLALVVGGVISLFVPLAPIAWRGAFKTGAVVVLGVISTLIPIWIDGAFPVSSIPVLILAALQAFATETGVQIRTYQPKHVDVSN
jgi:hypothetical protein